MSKGSRSPNPPLGVGLICALLLTLAALHNHQGNSGGEYARPEQDSQRASYSVPQTAPIVRGAQEPASDPNPDRNEWREERDLKAQQDMAKWAFWMLLVSGVALGVAVLGLVLVKLTLDAAHAANKGFVNAANRQLRAYVTVEDVHASAHATEDRVTFSVKVHLKNCGQTPAKDVVRIVELFPGEGHTLTNPRFQGFKGSREPLDIAPGQTFLHEYTVWSDYTPDQSGFQPGFEVVGRVEYKDLAEDEWRLAYSRPFSAFTAPFAPHLMTKRGMSLGSEPGELKQHEKPKTKN